MLYAYARDEQTPMSHFIAKVSEKHRTPVNALLVGATIPVAFTLLVNVTPAEDIHIGFFTYPANVSALTALVSFGVSGIYIAFGLTVLGALIARMRGWVPAGHYTLGSKGMIIIALAYLVIMFVNLALPSGLDSPRGGLFNLDWVTLVVVGLLALAGVVVRLLAPGTRKQ